MKPRWAPRWFTYVGLGPNPALPRPVGDSMPKAFDSGEDDDIAEDGAEESATEA